MQFLDIYHVRKIRGKEAWRIDEVRGDSQIIGTMLITSKQEALWLADKANKEEILINAVLIAEGKQPEWTGRFCHEFISYATPRKRSV